MDAIRQRFRNSLLLRWVAANMVGWTVGLIAGGYLIRLPDLPTICLPLMCLIGGFAGVCVGAAQWFILRGTFDFNRRWIILSFVGVALASLPAYFLGIFLFLTSIGASILGNIAALTIGALVGGGLGAAQSVVLEDYMRGAGRWWITACAAGGSICGLLSLLPILPPLPIGILLGTALYGYITGRVLLWLLKNERLNLDESSPQQAEDLETKN